MRTIVERMAVLIGVTAALAGVVLIWLADVKYDRQLTELRQVQDELNTIQTRRGTYQRLVQNLLAYSQSQPAIDAVLVPFGFKAAAQPQQPAASATAPSSLGSSPAAQPATSTQTPVVAPKTGGRQ